MVINLYLNVVFCVDNFGSVLFCHAFFGMSVWLMRCNCALIEYKKNTHYYHFTINRKAFIAIKITTLSICIKLT